MICTVLHASTRQVSVLLALFWILLAYPAVDDTHLFVHGRYVEQIKDMLQEEVSPIVWPPHKTNQLQAQY